MVCVLVFFSAGGVPTPAVPAAPSPMRGRGKSLQSAGEELDKHQCQAWPGILPGMVLLVPLVPTPAALNSFPSGLHPQPLSAFRTLADIYISFFTDPHCCSRRGVDSRDRGQIDLSLTSPNFPVFMTSPFNTGTGSRRFMGSCSSTGVCANAIKGSEGRQFQ